MSQPTYMCTPASVTITAVDQQTCGCSYECRIVKGRKLVSVQLCTICVKPCNKWYVQALQSTLQCCPICVRGVSDVSHCNGAFESCFVYDPVSVVCLTQCIFLSCWQAYACLQQMLSNGSTQANRSALLFNVTNQHTMLKTALRSCISVKDTKSYRGCINQL